MRLTSFLLSTVIADQAEDDLESLSENQVSYDLSEELLDRKGKPVDNYTIVVGGSASQKVYGISSIDGDIQWTKTRVKMALFILEFSLKKFSKVTQKLASWRRCELNSGYFSTERRLSYR